MRCSKKLRQYTLHTANKQLKKKENKKKATLGEVPIIILIIIGRLVPCKRKHFLINIFKISNLVKVLFSYETMCLNR